MRAPWVHPLANEQVQLGAWRVHYRLVRSARLSLGLQVDAMGLSVRAPLRLARAAIEAALHERADWLARHHDQIAARQDLRLAATPSWCDGAQLPWLGGTLGLRLGGSGPPTLLSQDPAPSPTSAETAQAVVTAWLHLALAPQSPPAQVRAALRGWWQVQARSLFIERLNHYAPRLGVNWSGLRLSNARTRWGSARANGQINLNWRLLHAPLALIDDVVAHELAHLREMNHSPAFWRWVDAVRPGHAQRRAALRALNVPNWEDPLNPSL